MCIIVLCPITMICLLVEVQKKQRFCLRWTIWMRKAWSWTLMPSVEGFRWRSIRSYVIIWILIWIPVIVICVLWEMKGQLMALAHCFHLLTVFVRLLPVISWGIWMLCVKEIWKCMGVSPLGTLIVRLPVSVIMIRYISSKDFVELCL